MKKIRVLTLIILSVVVCISCMDKSNIANGITGDKIKEIKTGMTLEDVVSILGMPYEIDCADRMHNVTCKNPRIEREISVNENTDIIHIVDGIYNDTNYCCDAYKESMQRVGKEVTLTYTKSPALLRGFVIYTMLWVHLDSNYCVRSVYAKRYEGPEGFCIYSSSKKSDETILEGKQEAFINEELFNKCFK